MPFLVVEIDCVGDFKPPDGSGTADALINPGTRMLRFPPGSPPAVGTTICFTYDALVAKLVFAQNTEAAANEGQKGVIANVEGMTTEMAQNMLDSIVMNPDEGFTVATQFEGFPIDEGPDFVPEIIPKPGTPVRVPPPDIPDIPNFPVPRNNAGGGNGPTEREDSKDEKGKHSNKVGFGPQDKHRITDYLADSVRHQNAQSRLKSGFSGPIPLKGGGSLPSLSTMVPRVFIP